VVELNKWVTLAADIFFVDGTAFLITMSRRIKFVTVEHVPVRTAKSLAKHIDQVVNVYTQAGFIVRTILIDREFEKIKDLVPRLECNTTAAKEHVSEAERGIRTVKERTRGVIATLPFERIPRRMKIEFVYFVVLWLNAFPVQNGSAVYSPQELLVRWRLDYTKHCRVLPGTYSEVHDKPLHSNQMTARTHEAIATGPTGNLQGSVKFYWLKTGQILKCRLFTALPMPDRVIKRVNAIGTREKQGQEFLFLNRRKEPYEWTDEVPEDDPKFQGLLKETAQYPDTPAKLPGVELKWEIKDNQVVTDEPEPDFAELAAAALENAGIDPQYRLRSAQAAVDAPPGPTLIEANAEEIVYKITFDLPDTGLVGLGIVPNYDTTPGAAAATHIDNDVQNLAMETVELLTDDAHQPARRYPTRSHRSVIGNKPYDRYFPHTTFLQLEEMQAHRSVLMGDNMPE
jgi:hypothetical protein